jgi:hypothetical protein
MTRKFLHALRTAACGAVLLSAGCETAPVEPAPEFIGDRVIVNDYAEFFRLGPQQSGGADLTLRAGDRVMLRRKEFGYSRVQLEDGETGYMANEDLQEAPPEPRRRPGRRGAPSGGARSGTPSGEEDFYEDIGLPDASLDILPEDLPLDPLPELAPTPAPAPETTPPQDTVPPSTPTSA